MFVEDQIFLRPDWSEHITREQMEPALANARMPDVVELHDAFARALPLVRAILDRYAHSG
jgi:hypothetical protein